MDIFDGAIFDSAIFDTGADAAFRHRVRRGARLDYGLAHLSPGDRVNYKDEPQHYKGNGVG